MTTSATAPQTAPATQADGRIAPFPGFSQSDFDVFAIQGLEPRMEALIGRIRPKLEELGSRITPLLSVLAGTEFYPHVAKHARRTVNPPSDTWVAFAANKRGYKAHPHFQIGLWGSHVFIQFAVIYEAAGKAAFAADALKQLDDIQSAIPDSYVWSGDHTVPGAVAGSALAPGELASLFGRLQNVKAAEILCGIHIDRHDPILKDGEAFVARAEQVVETLMPLYRLAVR
ncbi:MULTISPECIES: DUF1054 domain-containing protein [unclassified Paenibacillus]|uniref:YktB family protein n=1 Tax=unclassified Paenibacillus TaxID=185978 RepID=UPI000955C662|nr:MULTISPECIES: DUF1054 domain-containing protein [unclassified Paenibacillus]ASS65877.1 DUF1054 domain-containing protein [Paenibacillus sp. RUD330]SIQ20453.1 Uncharacterized protein YktB, UPF0637 family [Paenibacillus sp. RU4X]SIQ42153.1 Uncharacterized protein YktB, UPF0637 family [Paenibacillus sp. RU4T]